MSHDNLNATGKPDNWWCKLSKSHPEQTFPDVLLNETFRFPDGLKALQFDAWLGNRCLHYSVSSPAPLDERWLAFYPSLLPDECQSLIDQYCSALPKPE
jgi:hypothetical protein